MEQIRSTPKQQRPQAMQALMQSMPGYDGYRVSSLPHIKSYACQVQLMLLVHLLRATHCFRGQHKNAGLPHIACTLIHSVQCIPTGCEPAVPCDANPALLLQL